MKIIDLHILPRETMSWEEFIKNTPKNSIALDGIVRGGPAYDEKTIHINFDHHNNVVREATMSTCKQVYFAIKGGLFKSLMEKEGPRANVYINDIDQDVALSVWELENYKLIEGTQKIVQIEQLIELTDELDITGGSFPKNVDEKLMKQQNWVFGAYNKLRKSGKLAEASEEVMRENIQETLNRIMAFVISRGGEEELDTRNKILYNSKYGYKIIDEVGGNEARQFLFSKGLDAFISLIGKKDDGKKVWSIGRRSRYIPFPVKDLYQIYNEAEGLSEEEGWNGSDINGGSSRIHGSKLTYEDLAKLTDEYLSKKFGIYHWEF